MDAVSELLSNDTFIRLSGSLIALLMVLAMRALLVRALYARVSAPELRRRWVVSIRNGLFVVFVLALISIWATTI